MTRRAVRILLATIVAAGAGANAQVVIRTAPPAPASVAVVGRAPSAKYVWVPGYYKGVHARYVWVPGRWAMPPHPGMVWIAPRWAPHQGGYIFVAGRWR